MCSHKIFQISLPKNSFFRQELTDPPATQEDQDTNNIMEEAPLTEETSTIGTGIIKHKYKNIKKKFIYK